MASINLTGVLRDPLGEFSYLNRVRFTHNTTTGQTLKGFRSVHKIADDGSYDIDVEYGNVQIETHDILNQRWINNGVITINSDTPATDLPSLLGITTPATDEDLLVFQALVEDANQYAQSASASATIAEDAAQTVLDTPKIPAEALTGSLVTIRIDDNGNQNTMYKIPVFTNKMVNDTLGTNWLPETDVHPAFLRADNSIKPWFEIGTYLNSNDGSNNPVSAPFKDPYNTVSYTSAKSKCQSQGAGWHLVSAAEWAAVAIWCLMNDYQPIGNTFYGYSHDDIFRSGARQDGVIPGEASGLARTLTGTGGAPWNHNGLMQGIADMTGNVWEWQDGLVMNDGQLTVAINADEDESNWIAQDAFLDVGNKLNSAKTGDLTSGQVTWGSLGKGVSYVENQLLQQIMIEPITETLAANGRLYYNNTGERVPLRGGTWINTSSAGLGALNLVDERWSSNSYVGFRSAFSE